jgi:hypothetical protein
MTEVTAGAGAGEVTGGDGGGGGGTPPEWLATLPDDLKGDATLVRYADVPALAKAHIEAHRVAKSKLAVPGEGATDEQWGQVFDALGRPKEAAGYGNLGLEALPDTATADEKAAREAQLAPYRDAFHKIGLTPRQAEAAFRADSERLKAAETAFYAQGQAEVDAIKAEFGDQYGPKVAAAKAAFQKLGVSAELAQELDVKLGSGALVRFGMKLAEAIGEHGKIDAEHKDSFGDGPDANVEAKLRGLFRDKSWREKFKSGDATVVAQHSRLTEAARRAAVKSSGG